MDGGDRPRISYGDIALPLGGHLALSIKEKIWRGEFVDIFSLLQVEPEPVQRIGEPLRDQEVVRQRKIDKNWTNWLNGYFIYASVVLQMYPSKAVALFKYADIIHRAFRDYSGPAWASYDQHFRLRAAHDPALDWRVPQWELWSQLVVPSRPMFGDRSDSGHLIARNKADAGRAPTGAQGVQPPRTCYEFNAAGRCSRASCNFTHACVQCGAKHPVSSCPKLGWAKQGLRGQQFGRRGPPPPGSGLGKGADPN